MRKNDSKIEVSKIFRDLYQDRDETEVVNRQHITDYNQTVKDYINDEGKDEQQSNLVGKEELEKYFKDRNLRLSKGIPFGCDEKIFAVISIFRQNEYRKHWNDIVGKVQDQVIIDRIGVLQLRKMYAMTFEYDGIDGKEDESMLISDMKKVYMKVDGEIIKNAVHENQHQAVVKDGHGPNKKHKLNNALLWTTKKNRLKKKIQRPQDLTHTKI